MVSGLEEPSFKMAWQGMIMFKINDSVWCG